jgi:hypothetical protein
MKEKKAAGKTLLITVIVCAIAIGATLLIHQAGETYPKGMYVLYNENGRSVVSLSLRSDGSYVLNDTQDYSGYGTGSDLPVIIFHHDWQISDTGLTWSAEEKGTLTADEEQASTYILTDFFGGLFDEAEDVCLFYSEDQIFLYPASDDSTVIVMEKPQ